METISRQNGVCYLSRFWDKIFQSGNIQKIIVIITPLQELVTRAQTRKIIEPSIKDQPAYRSELWQKIYSDVDLNAIYSRLFNKIDDYNLKFECVVSSKAVPDDFVADRVFIGHYLRGKFPKVPSRTEVEKVINMSGAEYQTVDLPHGMMTSVGQHKHLGGSRNSSFSIIRDVTYCNKTVLDIGCALGDILFRTERLGAIKLTGIELKEKRYEAAKAIGSVLKSRAEFYLGDFLDHNFDDKFDDVYALNVIHHVSDVRQFIYKAAKLTKRRLIIEFPTLLDPRFSEIAKMPDNLNDLPLMGVSHSKVDQTFTFTPSAVAMMVSEAGEFKNRLLDSPIANRKIMVFSSF